MIFCQRFKTFKFSRAAEKPLDSKSTTRSKSTNARLTDERNH